MSRTQPKIGDVIEIPVVNQKGYAQYTHRHPQYGALIRVVPGVYASMPTDLASLVAGPHRFQTFFPLGAACKRGLVSIVATFPVPESAARFPVFRAGVVDPRTHRVGDNWWLWDGEKEWRVGALTSEQRAFPVRGIVNDTLLAERIAAEWSPEREA